MPSARVPGERLVEGVQGGGAVLAPGDDLGDHRVVAGGDLQALQQGRVHPDAAAGCLDLVAGGAWPLGGAGQLVQQQDLSGGRQEVLLRDLGVDARLHRVSGEHDVVLADGEFLAGGDADLPFDEVDAGDHLGDGVFDLQAGVHLHKEELVRGVVGDEEFHGAGAGVVDAAGGVAGGLAETGPDGRAVGQGFQQRGRGFLDDLLVPALQRALALAEVDDVAVVVREDLDLDVPRGQDEAFQEEGVVAEGAGRDPAGGDQGVCQVFGAFDDVHALPAAAGGGLDQQREADAGRGLDQLRVRHAGFGDARDHGDAVAGDVVLGADLVAHDVEGFDAGADEGDLRLFQGAGEVDVLAQEAVARVHGFGAGVAAGLDDGLDLEVALGGGGGADPHGDVGLAHVPGSGVGVGIDGDRTDAQRAQGADDAAGDLAAVGDEHGAEEGLRGCRARCWSERRSSHCWLTSGKGRRRSPAAGCGRRRRAPVPGRCGCPRGRSRRRPRGGRWSSRGCPGPRTAA